MIRIADIQTQVGTELASQPAHIGSMSNVLEAGKDIRHELIIAKTLENLAQTGVLNAVGKRRLKSDIAGSPYQADVQSAMPYASNKQAYLTQLNAQLGTLNTRIGANPLSTVELGSVRTELDNFVIRFRDIIRNDRALIMMVATLKHTITEKSNNEPGDPTGISPTMGHSVTSAPVNITGNKAHTGNTIELIDSTGNILSTDIGTAARGFAMNDIKGLKNGRQNLTLRTKNPTTNVIHETPYFLNIDLPTTPDTPDNLSKEITVAPTKRGRISGKLKTASHVIRIVDNAGHDITASCHIQRNPSGSFYVDLPLANIGSHKYNLIVSNGTEEHSEEITLKVSEPAAPTIAPIAMTDTPQMTHTDVEYGSHHVHIEHHNPIPGSTIVIAGQGLPNPVTVNVPLTHPHHTGLQIDLPGFHTSKTGIKNMTITTTDPHNATNKRVDNFDIRVQEDAHHVPEHRTLNKAYFLSCPNENGYQIHGDETITPPVPPIPAANQPPHYHNTHPIYEIGRSLKSGRLYAEVPTLPGDEKWFGRKTYVYSYTKKGLYDEIQLYLRKLNKKASAMNHEGHEGHGDHDAGHKHDEKDEKKEGHEKHNEKSEHKEGHEKHEHGAHHDHGHKHEHKSGTFYDRTVEKIFGHGILGKALIWPKNQIPKPLRSLGGNTVAAGITGGVVGGVVAGAGWALGSAALSSAVVPAIGITFTASMVNRFLKWRKWWPHNKDESGGNEHGHGGH